MENIPNHIEAAATVSAPISLSAMQMVRIEATFTQFVKQSPSWWTSTSGFAVPLDPNFREPSRGHKLRNRNVGLGVKVPRGD